MDTATYDDGEAPFSALKLSMLWQPWYAKAWWASAAVFWSAMVFVPGAARAIDGGSVFALSLFLHPFAPMWYLAGRYFWVRRQKLAFPSKPNRDSNKASDSDLAALEAEEVFGFDDRVPMSYLADPTDFRSPMNPANPAYIGRLENH
ncbi:hypothetical protein [Sphingobium sp. R-21]|uniref:hypothetical protein n=1 Tax=Sphingobium sp. R-21 TaxID=3404056 RepID=UPI003CF1484E